ncbi:SpoIIE family protein phosphatase [Streptomyces vinaceus]|uniref:SpoIIE family protein phosphatase n=1 Tax=Streptomyces vinaceus TaxID=1960 RepID=UPI0036D0B057
MTLSFTAPTTPVRIDHYSAVHLAADIARSVATECGLPGAIPDQAAVVASELASNIDKHASDGVLYIQPMPLGGGMEIIAADHGPGMPELQLCLTDGYSTTKTLGAGLGAVKRIATAFMIDTRPGIGTLVCARLTPPGSPHAGRQDVGLVCLPTEDEEHCGDAAAVMDTGSARTGAIIDGLGHGPDAAEAAQTALRSFRTTAERPLPDIVTAMHRALRHTRGAAVGLVRLHDERAEYCGIGNVRMVALSPGAVHHRLTGQPGVVGWRLPAPRTHRLPLPVEAAVVMHSDGIDLRWAHTPADFLLRLPIPLLAAAISHRHRHVRDDAAVLAASPQPRNP